MNIKDKIRDKLSHYKHLLYNKYYPPQLIFRYRQRRRLQNRKFSLLTSNCIAGYLYHQLGLPFTSPTINLMIYYYHFKKMILNLNDYLKLTPVAAIDPDLPSIPSALLGDIFIHFTHYSSTDEGIAAWEKRKKRIDYNNLYIIVIDMGFTKEEIQAMGEVQCKKIVVMTSINYGFDHCLYLPVFEGKKEVGQLLGKTLSGRWIFEKYFDFIGWVNSDDKKAQNFYIGKPKYKKA